MQFSEPNRASTHDSAFAPGHYLFHRGEVVGVEVRCPFCTKLHTHAAPSDGSFGVSNLRNARCGRGAYRITIGNDSFGTNFGINEVAR